ncbi:hypothetical protein [Polluticoccus soli]|uniref:hypothetical protein n=1 Tax=Polluticoccus soli TaxID=3034150 RepID=UPI0023E0F528|nr:hypothetical protein [Flavipsychrobacter sp. JY13-12]
MKRGTQRRPKGRAKKETEPNRTRQEYDQGQRTSGKKNSGGIAPAKVKTERTNNPPAKRQDESSNRRSEKDEREEAIVGYYKKLKLDVMSEHKKQSKPRKKHGKYADEHNRMDYEGGNYGESDSTWKADEIEGEPVKGKPSDANSDSSKRKGSSGRNHDK